MIDESNVIRKYVRGINFLKKTPPRVEDTSTATSRDTTDVDSDTFSASGHSNVGNDTIRSCESVLKIFTFKSKMFNKNNEKCLAFWNTINKRDDIEPVNCIIIDANNNQRDRECQTEEKESEASLWARALHELRKRKLDQLALITSSETCTYCKTINCPHKSPVFNPKDLLNHEDLTELNDWSPRTSNKTTQFSFKETRSRDVATAISESRVPKVVSPRTIPLKDNTMKKIYSTTKTGDSYSSQIGRTSDQNMKILRLSGSMLEKKRSGSGGFASCGHTASEDEKVSMIPLLTKSSLEEDKCDSVPGLLKDNKKSEKKHTETKKKVGISDIALKHIVDTTKTRKGKKSKKAKEVEREESPPKVTPTNTEPKIPNEKLAVKTSPLDLTTLPKNAVDKKHLSSVSFKLPENENKTSAELTGTPIKQISLLKKTDGNKSPKKLSEDLTDIPIEKFGETVSNDGSTKYTIDERVPGYTTSLKEVGGASFENFTESLPNLAITIDGKNIPSLEKQGRISPPSYAFDITNDSGKKEGDSSSFTPNFRVETQKETTSPITSILEVEAQDQTAPIFSNFEVEERNDTTSPSVPSVEVVALMDDSSTFIPNSDVETEEKIPKSEVKTERKFEEKIEQDPYREKSTGIQHLSSLLHMDTIKSLEKMVKERKAKLEQQLRSGSYVGSISGENEDTDPKVYLCPCLSTLKKSTCKECPCKKGICTKPTQSDLRIMERVLEHVPEKEKRHLKCFLKILYKVKDIMHENLNTEAMDAKIVKVLTGLGRCECEGGPCDCKIHHLDVGIMRDDRNFMAATILDKFNKVLTERLETKLGEVVKKKPNFENKGTKPKGLSVADVGVSVNRECNICKFQNCTCITK